MGGTTDDSFKPTMKYKSRTTPSMSLPRRTAAQCQHSFHSSTQLAGRKRPRFKNVRAAEMGLVTPEKVDEYTKRTVSFAARMANLTESAGSFAG